MGFVEPRRLAFEHLQPLLPVVCITWGDRAKHAILSLPHPPEMLTSLRGGSEQRSDSIHQGSQNPQSTSSQWGLGSVNSSELGPSATLDGEDATSPPGVNQDLDGLHAWVPNRATDKLVSFIDAAADHLRDLQIIDSVHFDVLTRKPTFLMYPRQRRVAMGMLIFYCLMLLVGCRQLQHPYRQVSCALAPCDGIKGSVCSWLDNIPRQSIGRVK